MIENNFDILSSIIKTATKNCSDQYDQCCERNTKEANDITDVTVSINGRKEASRPSMPL